MRKNIYIALFLLLSFGAALIYKAEAKKMSQISLDLGKNIHLTAKESGVPRFGVETHWGLSIYELVDMRADVKVLFSRKGYEISAENLFSITMYADSENSNDLAVERVELMYSPHAVSGHQEARILVDSLIRQFSKGRWRRYITETCPAVTGRSTYLDENGMVGGACALDPAFRIPMDDWLKLMEGTQRYEWLGDGVRARLAIHYREDSDGVTYVIDLEFQDFAIETRRYATKEANDLTMGDRKGWRSTEKHKKEMAEMLIKVKRLEENAVKRGDKLTSRKT